MVDIIKTVISIIKEIEKVTTSLKFILISVFLFVLAAIGSSPNLLLSIEWQIGLGILGLVFLALGIIIWYYQEKNRDRKISDSGSSLPELPRPSLYDPMYSNEQTRLEIQAKRNRDIDCEAFRVYENYYVI